MMKHQQRNCNTCNNCDQALEDNHSCVESLKNEVARANLKLKQSELRTREAYEMIIETGYNKFNAVWKAKDGEIFNVYTNKKSKVRIIKLVD
jgi:hypothetical protein